MSSKKTPTTKKPASVKKSTTVDEATVKPVTTKPKPVAATPKPKPVAPKVTTEPKYDTARVLKACRDYYKNTIRINEHRINMSSGEARSVLIARVNASLFEISSYYDKLRAACMKARPAKSIVVEPAVLSKIINLIENNSASRVEMDTSPLNHKSF